MVHRRTTSRFGEVMYDRSIWIGPWGLTAIRPLRPVFPALERVGMKYSLDAIPIEVLALALIEFVFVSTFAAVLWYMFGHK